MTESSTRTSGWIGAEASPPAGLAMWLWVSTRPGMIVLPARSCVSAPAGTGTDAPTATILPSRTTSVPFSMAGPLMGMMRALVKACVDWAWAQPAPRADRASVRMNDFSMWQVLTHDHPWISLCES